MEQIIERAQHTQYVCEDQINLLIIMNDDERSRKKERTNSIFVMSFCAFFSI